jgi:hypothetical protein
MLKEKLTDDEAIRGIVETPADRRVAGQGIAIV